MLAIQKSKGYGYVSFIPTVKDIALPQTTLETTQNGRDWTPVYHFDRMPFFDAPFLIDLPLNFRHLRLNPPRVDILKRMLLFAPENHGKLPHK